MRSGVLKTAEFGEFMGVTVEPEPLRISSVDLVRGVHPLATPKFEWFTGDGDYGRERKMGSHQRATWRKRLKCVPHLVDHDSIQ